MKKDEEGWVMKNDDEWRRINNAEVCGMKKDKEWRRMRIEEGW